jgi:phosphatidylserine decarboxylase
MPGTPIVVPGAEPVDARLLLYVVDYHRVHAPTTDARRATPHHEGGSVSAEGELTSNAAPTD